MTTPIIKYWDGSIWQEVGIHASMVDIQNSGNLYEANDVEGVLTEIAEDFNEHSVDTLPHQFIDGETTYRWGLSMVNGVVMFNYEEVE